MDTTGYVLKATFDVSDQDVRIWWRDLTPFAQGYVAAMMQTLREGDLGYLPLSLIKGDLRFGNISPRTLARIIADCEAWTKGGPRKNSKKEAGAAFWRARQASNMPRFPHLTVILGDDGKVRFA